LEHHFPGDAIVDILEDGILVGELPLCLIPVDPLIVCAGTKDLERSTTLGLAICGCV